MEKNNAPVALAFDRKRSDVSGTMFVYRQFKLPAVRHDEPFAKRKAGKIRRQERRFVRHDKECNLENTRYDPTTNDV